MPARVGAITRGDQRHMQVVRAPQIMGAHLICHVKYINIFMCNVTFETATHLLQDDATVPAQATAHHLCKRSGHFHL